MVHTSRVHFIPRSPRLLSIKVFKRNVSDDDTVGERRAVFLDHVEYEAAMVAPAPMHDPEVWIQPGAHDRPEKPVDKRCLVGRFLGNGTGFSHAHF